MTEESEISYNYEFLDKLFTILNSNEELFPILCGYFTKVVLSLLQKQKSKLLHYILIHKEGEIYNKLLNHLHHHSIAQLMVELIQVKIITNRPKENFSLDWDKDEKDGDSEEEKAQNG